MNDMWNTLYTNLYRYVFTYLRIQECTIS